MVKKIAAPNDWVLTDPDTHQYRRLVSKPEAPDDRPVYQFVQVNDYGKGTPSRYGVAAAHIYLNDYSPEDTEQALAFFGVDEASDEYLAEMFFEMEALESECLKFSRLDDAVQAVHSYLRTGALSAVGEGGGR